MNIGYVVWLENLNSIFIQSQVIEILKRMDDVQCNLIIFIDIKSKWRKDYVKKDILKILDNNRINLILVPVFLFPRVNFFFYNRYVRPIITMMVIFPLIHIVKKYQLNILHFRSYPIAHCGILIKQLFKDINIVFDPRSPFPEECALLRKWDKNHKSFKFWKHQEYKYLKQFDCTVAISNNLKKQFEKEHRVIKNIIVIPNNVDIELFSFNRFNKNMIRDELDIDKESLVFVYVGSLSLISWNNPNMYADLIIKFRELKREHKFIFVTKDKEELLVAFEGKKIDNSEYMIYRADHDDVPYYLAACDFGLNFMNRLDSRLSIKTVEYLSMGLPLVVNQNVKGAADIVEEYGLGYIVDENILDIDFFDNFQLDNHIKETCRSFASKRFSSKTVAGNYRKMYESLYNSSIDDY